MALVFWEQLRSMSKLPAEIPTPGPIPGAGSVRIGGRMMTPTKPLSADLSSSSATATAASACKAPGARRPSSPRGARKKEVFVDPNVAIALAAALKAELALAELDNPPEILQEQLMASALALQKGPPSSVPSSLPPLPETPPLPPPSRQHFHLPPSHPHAILLGQQPLTPEYLRALAERAAEFEVEHNWLLKEETEMKLRKFDQTKRKLTIFLPDDDPLEGISNRLEEVQAMVKPKSEFSTFLHDLSQEQRDRILKVAHKDHESLIRERRHHWKAADLIRNAFRMVYIMVCQCHRGRRYFYPEDPEAGPAVMRRQRTIYGNGKQPIKSSVSEDMQLSLTMDAHYRTPNDLKRVMWVLRATKAFKHLFPTEMEKELAKVVGYERYDDNRHIARQGRCAERFYYVLSGRIQLLKEYRLTSGCINKTVGYMTKGMTSDPEELEQGWLRDCHMVCKGPVEVLILHKDDFIRLQHTVQGPPLDFLWSIDLFKEFPCDHFLTNPDAIDFKYYGQNRIVASDISRTPWLHVVKSGIVKVVRVQYVFDVRNEKKFAAQSMEELGCGRSFSHAEAMLGLLAKQRKMKVAMSELTLPELVHGRSPVSIADGRRGKRKKTHLLQQTAMKSPSGSENTPFIMVEETEGHHITLSPPHSAKRKVDIVLPPISRGGGEPSFSNVSSDKQLPLPQDSSTSFAAGGTRECASQAGSGEGGEDNVTSARSKQTGSVTMPRTMEAALLVAHRTFLTREKTEPDQHQHHPYPPELLRGKHPKKEPLMRRAYLQLDLLKPGDVFVNIILQTQIQTKRLTSGTGKPGSTTNSSQ